MVRRLSVRLVGRLRSNFFIAIVSLWVLSGYGIVLLGDCCDHHEHAQVQHETGAGSPAQGDQDSGDGDDCQCVCHIVTTALMLEPVWAADAAFVETDLLVPRDDSPPDAMPRGIDYPPQLA